MTIPTSVFDQLVESIVADFSGDWTTLVERISGMVAALVELEASQDADVTAAQDAPTVIGAVIERIGIPAVDHAVQAAIWGMSDRTLHRATGEAWLHAHPDERAAFERENALAQFEAVMKNRSLSEETKILLPPLPSRTVHFRAFRDEDAGVWVATNDADRISTERATKEEIISRLSAIVPDVLESRCGRIGKVLISIDWQELRTVEQTTLAVA